MELTSFKRITFTGGSINSLSFSEFSPDALEQRIKEVKEFATGEIRIKETSSTNGQHFVTPLQTILNFLQQLVCHQGKEPFLEQDDDYESKRLGREIYSTLHLLGSETMPNLIMYLKNITTNGEEMCTQILDVLAYLLVLDQSASFSFPTLFASCLLHMPKNWSGAVDAIMKHLCYNVLPLVLLYPTGSSKTVSHMTSHMSMSATLMLVLDNNLCQLQHHMMIAGTLMRCKKNVCSDLLSVIAYGTQTGRDNALKVLLHFWPVDHQPDRLNDSYIYTPKCDFSKCSNRVEYLCLDAECALKHSKKFSDDGKKKLFMLLCSDCNGNVHRSQLSSHKIVRVLPVIRDVKPNCELRLVCNKEEPYRRAEVTCFGEGCASIQDGFPVRMCMDCHRVQHTDLGDDRHMYQVGPQNPWTCEEPMATSILLEAMTKLLQDKPVKNERRESRRVSTVPSYTPYHIVIKPTPKVFAMLQHYFTPDQCIDDFVLCQWFERIVALVLEWLLAAHTLVEEMITESVTVEKDNARSGSLLVNYQKTVEGACKNHQEIHNLVVKQIIPWLKSLCSNGNTGCIVTALLPKGPAHVQVGDTSHDDIISQYRRTLSLLILVTQNHFLSEEATTQVYNEVMPCWMNLLVNLRSTPGQMEKLKDLLLMIFPEDGAPHTEQLKRFDFIRGMFQQKDPAAKQKALFWLQDLSRLNIIVPYTFHIFDDIFHKKGTNYSTKASTSLLEPMPLLRKESTGSFSGYDSEPPLVSQFSEESNLSNTQRILDHNFALSRYIVMLDIWNSQLNLSAKGSLLCFESFQRFSCLMLEKNWENDHASSDHIGSFSTCLFCQAYAIWFSLATHIIEHYSHKEDDGDDNVDGEPVTPPLPSKKRASKVSRSSGKKKVGKADDDDILEYYSHSELPRQETKYSPRDRRQPIIATRSQLQLDLSKCTTPTKDVPVDPKDLPEQPLPRLYMLFKLCVQKVNSHYHPDSMVQAINYITILVSKFNVLKCGIKKEVLLEDVRFLLKKLWKILEGTVSYLSQGCVTLLLACQLDSIALEVSSPTEISASEMSTLIHNGLNQKKWKNVIKTVCKLFNILQFMTGTGLFVMGTGSSAYTRSKPHRYIELILATSFCKMTRLLHSKDSIVTTKVHYCLTNLKNNSVEAIRECLFLLYVHVPIYRFTVLQTLTLLTSAVPTVPFLSASLIQKLLYAVDGLSHSKDPEEVFRMSTMPEKPLKKESNVSIISGRLKDVSAGRPSITSSALSIPIGDDDFLSPEIVQLKCDSVALLIKFLTTATDFSEFRFETGQSKKSGANKGGTEDSSEECIVYQLQSYICRHFHTPPKELCQMRMFEMFLHQSYKLLDKNYKFCETKSFIPFTLRLLGYSVSPSQQDYPYIQGSGLASTPISVTAPNNQPCSLTLSNLPNKLQAQWLRVLFIVMYKYTKTIIGQSDTILYLQWCIDIVLNTLQCSPHVCPGPRTTELKSTKVSLVTESPSSPLTDPNSSLPLNEGRISRQLERNNALPTVLEETGGGSSQSKQNSSTPTTRPRVIHTSSVASFSSSFTSGLSIDQQVQPDTQCQDYCRLCYSAMDIYSEEVIALGVLCLGTCAHHSPNLVSSDLVTSIIPCISRVVIPGNYYWQDSSLNEPPPGSGMSIAKQFLLTILTQFAERRVFIYLLRHNHKKLKDTVFSAIAISLNSQTEEEKEEEEEEDLTLSSLVEHFLEDAFNSTHFSSEVTAYSLVNLSCYLEKVPDTSAGLFMKLPYLDVFLKKLRHNESKKVLYKRDTFRYFLKIIIQLLKFSSLVHSTGKTTTSSQPVLPSTLVAIFQEFPDILTESLQLVSIPAAGFLMLVREWFKAFLPFTQKRRDGNRKLFILKLLIDQFSYGLSIDSSLLPENLSTLPQAFLLLLDEYVYMGYIDTLTPDKRVYAPSLQLEQELNLNSIVSSISDTTGIERCFTEAMNEALKYLALLQPRASYDSDPEVIIQVKLNIAQMVALRIRREKPPVELASRIIHSQFDFHWIENKSSNATGKNKGQLTSASTFIDNNINSLQALGWLMLGAMTLNAFHEAVQRTSMYGKLDGVVTAECEILLKIFNNMYDAVECLLKHVKEALKFLVEKPTYAYWGLKSILCFSTICTVYMEFTCTNSLPEVTHFWQQLVDRIIELPSKKGMRLCNEDIVDCFCEQAIIPLKRIRVSCVSMLQPTWKRIFNLLQNLDDAELPEYVRVDEVSSDVWMREMLRNYVKLESEYLQK